MRKILLTALLAACTAMGAQAQLLYKISGNDLAKPSYIIGTHHLANVSFVDKITGVRDALTATDQVYGELDFNVTTNTDSMRVMQKAMTLPDGKTLKEVLTADQYKKLDNFLKQYMGVGLSQPMVAQQFGSLTPAALTQQLTVLVYLQRHMGDFDPSSSFDQWFQAQAKKNNEPVHGLETLSFQADLLFKQPLARQIEGLMCLIDHTDFQAEAMDEMTDAYYAQDLDKVKAAMDKKQHNLCDTTPEENAALISDRNARWAAQMPAIMSGAPTFFVVGAGHLPGEDGVLQLLRTAGYTVEAVK